jgi:hypothetical protein
VSARAAYSAQAFAYANPVASRDDYAPGMIHERKGEL